MPGDNVFVDTNVLLYSFDVRDAVKRARSRQWVAGLWEAGRGRISWQVLHEFYANAVRKIPVSTTAARDAVSVFSRWQPCETTLGTIERAWYWMDMAQLSYWDSMILAAAERLGCGWLLTEDLQVGRSYEGVVVINPFKSTPADLGLLPH